MIRIVGFLLLTSLSLQAQDTLRVSLRQADSLLLARNLSLVVSRFEIDRAVALKAQAKLFNNPELSTEWNLYNPSASKWLDVGGRGQKILQLEQVFRIAGQRNLSIRLAEEEKRITESEYLELARSLRYQLHVSYYRYHFLGKAITNIQSQLALLKSLIDIYSDQYRKGNISLQELTRLNTTYFTISNQVSEVQQELASLQGALQVLLAENMIVVPTEADSETPDISLMTLDELAEQGVRNRPEMRTIESMVVQNRLKHDLARREAFPDLTAGFVYDQSGSFVDNYTAVTLGLQIPIFNRNQGTRRATAIGVHQAEALLQSREQQIRSEVRTAWNVYHILREQYAAVGENYEDELQLLSEGLVNNYSKNNISLLEFTDLFEAYNTNILQYNQLKADLNKSYEELIYAVGEDLAQ